VPRAIWSGSISFGLVNVPVKLFPAVRSHDIRFTQLHRDSGGRVRRKRVDETTGEEVAYDDIVKGYEVGAGRYVLVDPDEIDALAPEASRTIDIHDFVARDEIDPLYYDRPYYLAPATASAGKPYRLLLEAMQHADKVAIASFVMRTKEHLVALRAQDGVMVANTMNFVDEVQPADRIDGLELAEVDVNPRELEMAQRLIDSLVTRFDATAYEDRHHQRVISFLESKAEGRQVAAPEAAADTGEVIDLMAALERSLAAGQEAERASAGATGVDDADDYRELSKSQLYDLAQQRDVEGRSGMTKAELIAALRERDADARHAQQAS
jgi:DNA end-binding protein Ku